MKYANIKNCDIANGLGVRVSLFVSGCTHHCPGCFNEIAWDFNYGNEFTSDTEKYIIDLMNHEYIKGLSLLGGEPIEPSNQKVLLPFLRKIKHEYPDKDIWCYTGYLYEDLMDNGKVHTEDTDELLSYIDILVDGPFIMDKKDITLKWKGSSNQRVIDLKQSLKNKEVILME